MGKRIKRLQYALADMAESSRQAGFESIFYWAHFLSSGFSLKFLGWDILGEYYEQKSIARKFERLHKKGYIKKLGDKGNVLWRFLKKNRFAYLSKTLSLKAERFDAEWDKRWRLVIYDVPDKLDHKRDRLREYLVSLGFGKIQHSCWVSPYDFAPQIYDFCQGQKISDCVCLYEGGFYSGKNTDRLVRNAWPLHSLRDEYESLIASAQADMRDLETEDVSKNEYYARYCVLFEKFKGLLEKDPFLPKKFAETHRLRSSTEAALMRLFQQFTPKPALKP